MAAVGINLSSSLLSAATQAGGPSAINQLLRSAQSKSTSQASDPDGDGDTHRISKAGQFLSKLQSLKQSDPTKFKELLTQISDQLSAAALQAGAGTQQNQFLSQLAAKFKDVANGGDISQLQPPRSAGNRLQEAYGQGQRSSQQVMLDFIKNNGPSPATDSSTKKLFGTILAELNQATATTVTK